MDRSIELSVKSPCLHPWLWPPIPSQKLYPQSKEILLNLRMKCAFNAQGSRVIIVVVQVGAVKNICSNSGGAQEKKKDRMNLNLPPKLVEKN